MGSSLKYHAIAMKLFLYWDLIPKICTCPSWHHDDTSPSRWLGERHGKILAVAPQWSLGAKEAVRAEAGETASEQAYGRSLKLVGLH